MKALLILSLPFLISQGQASVPESCFTKASSAVERSSFNDRYDVGGFETLDCERSLNRKVVLCEVSASKGDGAATDTFRVVLSESCSRVLRIDLIGEE
ncbi:MAG: hypothetical protein ACLGG7_09165 [Bacteriovoracia bacterium]